MDKEDKQIIDRAIKENWRTGDRTRLKRLLEKNLKLYRENEELKLELTVQKDQLQEETNLHLHAEEYNKSLEKENNKLLDVINNQDVKIADLEKRIEKMKCCSNCAFEYPKTNGNSEVCRRCRRYPKPFTEWKLDKWEIKENE